MVGKPRAATSIGFVPTAANVEPGNKDWFFDQYITLRRHGFSRIDVVDPSAAGVLWQKRLEAADVIFVGGGNTFHLLDQARKTGFGEWTIGEVSNHKKVYLGASAGSLLVTSTIAVASVEGGDENLVGLTDLRGLALVDFEFLPHVPDDITLDAARHYASQTSRKLYVADNQSAVQVQDGVVRMLSEGVCRVLNS